MAFNGIGRDPLADADKKLPVYNELVRGLKAENKAIKAVRLTEEQIREDLSVSLKNSELFSSSIQPSFKIFIYEVKFLCVTRIFSCVNQKTKILNWRF